MEMIDNQNVQNEISKIYNLTTKALKKLGYKELGNVLKALVIDNEFTNNNYGIYINYILECVVDEWKDYGIKKDDIFKSNKRGEIIVARKMAIILIKKHCDKISDNKLATHFGNRCRQVVYGVRKEYEKMNPDNKIDSLFLDIFKKIDFKISAFIDEFNKENQNA